MKAAIREIPGLDVDVDIANVKLSNPSDEGISVRMMIGPDGDRGDESLHVLVCTPQWLRDEIQRSGLKRERITGLDQ